MRSGCDGRICDEGRINDRRRGGIGAGLGWVGSPPAERQTSPAIER